MSPLKLNFEGVSTTGFAPYPVNEPIEFTIFNITQEKGKDSGEPYLKFEFQQAGGKRKAWSNFSLTPQALWRLKKLLVDLGEDEDDLEDEFELELADLMGKSVMLTFGPEREYNGKTTQDVRNVTAA